MKRSRIVLSALAIGVGLAVSMASAMEVQRVAEDAYAIAGPKGQRSAENLGNNATFGAVVTGEGVVLIDAGGSWKGAEEIERTISRVTDKPVKIVINTGGQDHRWFGNAYWKAKGARIIASEEAVKDQRDRGGVQLDLMKQFIGDRIAGTTPVFADETFKNEMRVSFGGVDFLLVNPGQAHTPGDAFVWLPDRKLIFAGDIVFTERLLGVLPMSNAASWMKSFEAMAAFAPAQVVPGHGAATDLLGARKDTYAYLLALRASVRALMDRGGSLSDAPKIDQSAFAHLEQFESLAGRNAAQVYTEMEME